MSDEPDWKSLYEAGCKQWNPVYEQVLADRDQWKARAEAAEAKTKCELGITDRSICSAGTCYDCISARLASSLARAEAAEAELAHYQAEAAMWKRERSTRRQHHGGCLWVW
jgi:hypothetical protein